MKPLSDTQRLPFPNVRAHHELMRLRFMLIMLTGCCAAQQQFGSWTLNIKRSTFGGDSRPKAVALRIEPHAKGEVVTFERTEMDGRALTNSTLLYLDGNYRRSDGVECSESSRQVKNGEVEIVRNCTSEPSTRLLRRVAPGGKQIIFEILVRQPEGSSFQQMLVFERRNAGI
jgi:hypothetical protein